MASSVSTRARLVSATATAALHGMLLLALLLAVRPPFPMAQHHEPSGLSVFDLAGPGLAAKDDGAGAGNPEQAPAPPPGHSTPPAVDSDSLAADGFGRASAGGVSGAAAGDADPFALASLRAGDGVASFPDPIIAEVAAAFRKMHPGINGAATISLSLGPDGKVTDAHYVAGTIGTIRGATLAGFFHNCPVKFVSTGNMLAMQLAEMSTGEGLPETQPAIIIDDEGCHL